MRDLAIDILFAIDAEAQAWTAVPQPDGTFIATDRERFTQLDLDYNNPLETKYTAEVFPDLSSAEDFMALRAIEYAIATLNLVRNS